MANQYPAPAKLNLSLLVTGRRSDGYHLLQTVFRFIDFGDQLQIDVRDDGRIDVLNRCRKHTLDGPEDVSHGQARVVDRATNAKLEVSFFRPFWGPYWIIVLDPDYQYAVVGHPSRDYLWILSRTPQMAEALYAELVAKVRAMGYDDTRLRRTVQ